MVSDTDKQRLRRLLTGLCPGSERAMTQARIARLLGWNVRQLQLVADALDHETGHVGSSCGARPGLYWIATVDELDLTCANFEARGAALFERSRRKRLLFNREPQMALLEV